jgi:RNA recognition motif-containing protein
MRLEFAKTPSDETVKRMGTAEEFEHHKRRRLAEKGMRPEQILCMTLIFVFAESKQVREAEEAKKKPSGAVAEGAPKPRPKTGAAAIPDEFVPPNKILFLQNLSKDMDVEALTAIFARFEGFREVRLVPSRQGIAFVEYVSEQQAIKAKEATANMVVGKEGKAMKVTYQRQ